MLGRQIIYEGIFTSSFQRVAAIKLIISCLSCDTRAPLELTSTVKQVFNVLLTACTNILLKKRIPNFIRIADHTFMKVQTLSFHLPVRLLPHPPLRLLRVTVHYILKRLILDINHRMRIATL